MSNRYDRVDRSTLNYLPPDKRCIRCDTWRASEIFDLKKKNQFTQDKPYELEDICKVCKQVAKEERKDWAKRKAGLIQNLTEGQRMVSDEMIKQLNANGGERLKRIVQSAIEHTLASGDVDMFRLIFTISQGHIPYMSMKEQVKDMNNLPKEEEKQTPTVDHDALLQRLKPNESTPTNTVDDTVRAPSGNVEAA